MQVNLLEVNVVLHSRETAIINGSFSTPGLSGEAEVRIFDPIRKYSLGPNTNVSKKGNQLFRGRSEVTASQYNSAFIVPDDIISGNKGLCVSYIWDEATKKDYTNYYFPLDLVIKQWMLIILILLKLIFILVIKIFGLVIQSGRILPYTLISMIPMVST
jgi:hypothetical protein